LAKNVLLIIKSNALHSSEKNIDIQRKSGEQVAKYKSVFMKYMYVCSELNKKTNTKSAGIVVVHV